MNKLMQKHSRSRDSLIPVLQEVQEQDGYISPESVKEISGYLKISESDIYGVATFYTQFRFTRPGDHMVRACQGTACHVRGGKRIPGETTEDYKFSLDSVACFGSCALSPVVVVDDTVYGRVTPQKVRQLLKDLK